MGELGDDLKKGTKQIVGQDKPKPDHRAELLRRRQMEEIKERDSEIAERKAARLRFSQGRASLLSNAATGVASKETLG